MNKMEMLLEAVIEQIKVDINNQDTTAIEEMIIFTDTVSLIEYLPEEKCKYFREQYELGNIHK